MINSGIYKITNTKNGKFYIGSSVNIQKRWNAHKRALRKNKHENILLQRSWNKYGEEYFQFEIIEETNDVLLQEQHYLDELKPYDPKIGFNIGKQATGGDNLTNHPDKENIITQIKQTCKTRYANMSEEEKQQRSNAVKGDKNPNFGNKWNAKQRKRMSKYMTGRKHSAKTIELISNNTKQMWQNEESRKKLIEARTGEKNHFYGKKHSEESLNKIRLKKLSQLYEKPIEEMNCNIVKIKNKIYVGIEFAAIMSGISQNTIRYRCNNNKEKWNDFQFLDKSKLTPDQKTKLIFRPLPEC